MAFPATQGVMTRGSFDGCGVDRSGSSSYVEEADVPLRAAACAWDLNMPVGAAEGPGTRWRSSATSRPLGASQERDSS